MKLNSMCFEPLSLNLTKCKETLQYFVKCEHQNIRNVKIYIQSSTKALVERARLRDPLNSSTN